MTEVLIAVLATIVVDELIGVSRWVAGRVARWAARRIYLSDAERAKERAEEWHALVSESIPTSISALCFSLGLGVMALACMAARRVTALGSLVSRASKMLPDTNRTRYEWRERHITERRAACLSLMQAAGELKLHAADVGSSVDWIRQQAMHTQMRAARVALLAPDSLAEPAECLAVIAGRLADATAAGSIDTNDACVLAICQELDESVRAFWRAAVDTFRDGAALQ